jgi:hypothetical protein
MILLSLALVISSLMLMTSCGGGEEPCTEHVDSDDNGMCDNCNADILPNAPVEANVTITVKDQDGARVSGITLTLTESGAINGEGKITATSGADGTAVLKLKSGVNYLVSADYNVDEVGYYALTTTKITVESTTTAIDVLMENRNPNGTESRPYNLSVAENDLTVPAGETVHYILYRAFNLMATVQAADIKIEYEDTVYTPDANGLITFPFIGADTNYVASIKITSTGTSDAEVSFVIESFPGTLGNPFEITSLGETVTNTDVEKGESVYYSYKATAAGTLTLTVESSDTHASMQNNSYQTSTTEADSMTISLDVAVGDEVMINLTTSADESPVISFTVSVE